MRRLRQVFKQKQYLSFQEEAGTLFLAYDALFELHNLGLSNRKDRTFWKQDFGGVTQTMLQGVNEVEWLQIVYCDAVFNDIQLDQWRNSLSPTARVLPACLTVSLRSQ